MDVKDFVLVMNSPDPGLTIDELIELKEQNTIKETNGDFEPTEKIKTIAKLTEGLNLIDAGVTVIERIDSDE